MILTDEEIAGIGQELAAANNVSDLDFARDVESAVLAKLAEGEEIMMPHANSDALMDALNAASDKIANLEAELKSAQDELAALRVEVDELKARNRWHENGTESIVGYPWETPFNDGYETAKCEFRTEIVEMEERLAAAQAENKQLREALAELHRVNVNNYIHDPDDYDNTRQARMAVDALALPSDTSALDAYLAPYKLDAELLDYLISSNALVCQDSDGYFLYWHTSNRCGPYAETPRAAIASVKEKKGGAA